MVAARGSGGRENRKVKVKEDRVSVIQVSKIWRATQTIVPIANNTLAYT